MYVKRNSHHPQFGHAFTSRKAEHYFGGRFLNVSADPCGWLSKRHVLLPDVESGELSFNRLETFVVVATGPCQMRGNQSDALVLIAVDRSEM